LRGDDDPGVFDVAIKKPKQLGKRTKNHPTVIRRKKRAEKPRGAWYRAFRGRVEAILARHAAARAELDERIRGADLTSLAHLEVVVFPRGKPRPLGLQRLMKQGQDARADLEERFDPDIDAAPYRAPIAPPVPFTKHELSVSRRPRDKKAA
jgi:hypothetical protein